MSLCRHQGFIDAPVDVVWDLISDIEHHPEWWPRVVEVEVNGDAEGDSYRQVTQTPVGKNEMQLLIESREELRNLRIRCLNTGTFLRFEMTDAHGGTFVDGEMGMEPHGLKARLFDAAAGRRYFRDWISATFKALDQAAKRRAGP